MPFYEYQCTKCNHAFSALQKMTEEPLLMCPECNKEGLRKLVSAPSFSLKGSGWYETDFKDKKKSTKTDDKSTDTKKPATKTDNTSKKPADTSNKTSKPKPDSKK